MQLTTATRRIACLLAIFATAAQPAWAVAPGAHVQLPPNCQTSAAQSHYKPSVGRYGFLPPPPASVRCLPPVEECAVDCHAQPVVPGGCDFSPDPCYWQGEYDPCAALDVYGGRYEVPTQRPWVEGGMPFYSNGPIPQTECWCGPTNPVQQKFYVYGDYRVGAAVNRNVNRETDVLAARLNLELDYWITSTERIHAFTGPLQDGAAFTRFENGSFKNEIDFWSANTDTLFFEGDLGQMLGGWEHTYAPFDLPVTVGLIPMLFQNGTWMLDAFWGAAVTLPARNNPWLDWSNYDITFFTAFDQVSTDAFGNSLHTGSLFGATTFIEARGGYFEIGYAYVADDEDIGRDYHNLGLSYTRRYLGAVSNSVRVIVNEGQSGPRRQRTADGVLLLVENSLITQNPYNVIPYCNFFAGIGRPQPAARAAAAGGVLFNTGILFQSDALTGYPTLDASGNNTLGASIGLDLLAAPNFNQQLIVEAAALHTFDDDATRNAPGPQYGVGARWQLPITNAYLIRVDAMHGWLENSRDISGVRGELRWKF
ncbi:hypothetical protein Pla123a_06530 [Posidoniimonas polymericola]|uniref:Porin subfamily protein n=1 Tax=Posidoniimonas polymericola TaxID=2528002 RepID=A0A5C5ZF82_9BACT|nr:hypothetical protein [Posidoniimonas polymericola]TWT85846.1 hypothetical protein Pla123a_06530 [Posidoniimonas polymericola]